MSKVSNALNMYFLLQSRGPMKVSEIAEELEVSPRMIKSYKNDLEMAGIYISSKLGRSGYYFLENDIHLNMIGFTEDELASFKMAMETIKSGKYHFSKNFEIAVNKILNCQSNRNKEINDYNKNIIESDYIVKKEKSIWVDINIAINSKRRMVMDYKSLKKNGVEVKKREVDPYGIFDYKGATYFYGYCYKAENIRFFKLSRIINYKILDVKYKIKKEFDFNQVLHQSFGIYNDEKIYIKLEIYYPMSEIIKEKQICKDQKIHQINEKTILFEATMSGYKEIKSWVMSMGSKVKIIEPDHLKQDVLDEYKGVLKSSKIQ